MRNSTAATRARLRKMIGDPAGAAEHFTEDELEDYLDQNRTEIRYGTLEPWPTLLPGGIVEYREYRTGERNFEDGMQLFDAAYINITANLAASAEGVTNPDPVAGTFTFAAEQLPPVLLMGHVFDLHGAAADALEDWASTEKDAIDFSTDSQSFRRSQRLEHRQALARRHRARAKVHTGAARTPDVF